MRRIPALFTLSRHPFDLQPSDLQPLRARLAVAMAVLMTLFMSSAARAQIGDPIHAATYLDVSAASVSQGVELLKKYRDEIRRDGRNLEFTILQESDRPNRFVIFESWTGSNAFEAYDKSAASLAFQDALKPIRNSPPDRHMLLSHAVAPVRAASAGALYMVEHLDFLGGDPAIATAAAPLVVSLAANSQKDPGAMRYDIYRQPPPRGNHYEVVSAWTDANAFAAHETASHKLAFRSASAQGLIWRCNLYDQRLYKAL